LRRQADQFIDLKSLESELGRALQDRSQANPENDDDDY